MSFSQSLIFSFSPWLLGAAILVLTVLFTVIGLVVFRAFVPHHKLKAYNDIAGFMFGTLGVIYAVLLAFTVIIVWENFDQAEETVQREANVLADLYRDAGAFTEQFSQEVSNALIAYGKSIVKDEWPMLQEGKKSPETQEKQNNIWELYTKYQPVKEGEKIFFQESVNKLNELCEMRRLRLMESKDGIDAILWFVLVFCGCITVVFTFFFGVEHFKNHVIMTCFLAVTIALILFTILEFDYPFTGDISIAPRAFTSLRMFDNVVLE
jgi:hypothetical protein